MNNILVIFSSFATASRVKNLLQKKNINSKIMQTPAAINLKSCSYCLEMSEKHADVVWNIIKSNDLYSKGIFSAETYTKIK